MYKNNGLSKSKNPLTVKYPYTDGNFFDQPEFYEYADCHGDYFLDGWRRHRQEGIRRLGNVLPYPLSSVGRLAQHSKTNQSILESGTYFIQIMEFLISRAHSIETQEDATTFAPGILEGSRNTLDVFLKKFEIFRRFYKVYDDELNAVKSSGLAEFGEYFTFGVALIIYHKLYRDPRLASVLLKLIDAMLSRWGGNADREKAEKLVALIQAEAEIVEGWLDYVERDQK